MVLIVESTFIFVTDLLGARELRNSMSVPFHPLVDTAYPQVKVYSG